MRNIKLSISYDGSNYHGWQKQPGVATVQETLEHAIQKMVGHKINLVGSGRTDAGVHAICQSANFFTNSGIPLHGFEKGLNSLLPPDISVLEAQDVPKDFHARKNALAKSYMYRIVISDKRLPLIYRKAWIVRERLGLKDMTLAAKALKGRHDFSSFMAAGSSVRTTIRQINHIEIRKTICHEYLPFEIEEYQIRVKANGFLKYMVRNITGLLKEIGTGRLQWQMASRVLAARDRTVAPATAPAYGLYLEQVEY